MRQLRLVGVADDGASLLLETPTGDAFRLPLDERVRAACRGDLTRLGQIEIEMDNPLRPREIQARVRAGESAEEVAASSGMPLDRVLRFASPMLQERERVVAQARTAQVHAKRPETLAQLVEERLVGRGTDAATLRWDAWRREDGKWTVRLSWRHAAEHSASWVFQLATRTLQPDDPAAEQLSAEEFHARTITAVTPLAVAARVSGRPGGASAHPAGTGRPSPGDRPARGVEARAGRSPGTLSGADAGRRTSLGRATGPAGRESAPGPEGAGSTAGTDPGGGAGGGAGAGGGGAGLSAGAGGAGAGPTAGADRSATVGDDRTHTAGVSTSSGSADAGTASGSERITGGADRTRIAGTASTSSASAGTGSTSAASAGTASTSSGSAGTGTASGSERTAGEADRTGSAGTAERTESRSAPTGGRSRRRAAAPADAGDEAPPRRIAAGGESDLRAETDEERARRASVPSWDDILLGVRRRH